MRVLLIILFSISLIFISMQCGSLDPSTTVPPKNDSVTVACGKTWMVTGQFDSLSNITDRKITFVKPNSNYQLDKQVVLYKDSLSNGTRRQYLDISKYVFYMGETEITIKDSSNTLRRCYYSVSISEICKP